MMYNNIFAIYWNAMLDIYINSLEQLRKTWHEVK